MGQPITPPADPGTTPPAADSTKTTTPPADPPKPPATGDDPAAAAMATEAGKKALAELRAQNKALEQQLAALEPLKALAGALGVKPQGGKTDVEALTEQVTQMQRQMAEAELRAVRLEVAAAKGLTPAQADRLRGDSREALEIDADQLKTLFPATAGAGNGGGTSAPGTPRPPAPDGTQGARGGAGELEALLAKAVESKDVREQIRLKTLIAHQRGK